MGFKESLASFSHPLFFFFFCSVFRPYFWSNEKGKIFGRLNAWQRFEKKMRFFFLSFTPSQSSTHASVCEVNGRKKDWRKRERESERERWVREKERNHLKSETSLCYDWAFERGNGEVVQSGVVSNHCFHQSDRMAAIQRSLWRNKLEIWKCTIRQTEKRLPLYFINWVLGRMDRPQEH